MSDVRPEPFPGLPHRARLWNYWLGGKDHYEADRNSADAISAAFPTVTELVRSTRRFGERVVRHLAAEHGVRQFLDVGTGLPADRDVHAVLRDIAPDARVVHLDHDPFVLLRATAMPLPSATAVYRDADFRDPAAVLAAAAAELDLQQPVAILYMGMLGYLGSPAHAVQAVRDVLDGLAAGSFLAVWEATATSDDVRSGAAVQADVALRSGIDHGYRLSTVHDVEQLFDGLELLEPGVVPVAEWRPDDDRHSPVDAYGGIARLTSAGAPAAAATAPARVSSAPRAAAAVRTDASEPARVWNYWLGGKDHYAADRAVGDAIAAAHPEFAATARAARRFLVRAVTHLAEAGVRQFLDIGSGLPTGRDTHEIAQAVTPDARIVYVDNDPLVLLQARSQLVGATSRGSATYIEADFREPEALLEKAAATIDLREPVGVLFMGVLGYVDPPVMHRAVHAIVSAVPPGSHLALWDATDTSSEARATVAAMSGLGLPYRLNTVDELQECFAGLEMVEPGLVSITTWHPEPADDATGFVDGYGGIGRKPEQHHEEGNR